MKMGNIVSRSENEPTALAFWASVLPVHHLGSLMSPLYPRPPIYVAPCLRGQCRLFTRPPGIVSFLMLTITYKQWPYIYTYTG